MYLYSIPQNTGNGVSKLSTKQTKLKKQNLKAQKTKKQIRSELDGGSLGCTLFGVCKMPKDTYKSTKQLLIPELAKAFNIPTDTEKYKELIEEGLDHGFLRDLLHGIYAKMGSAKRKLLTDTYLDYIKKYIKLLTLSANPEGVTNTFPIKYSKYNEKGKLTDETGQETNSEIEVSRGIISPENLAVHIDNIIRADKQNLNNIQGIKNKTNKGIRDINKFIFDETSISSIQVEKKSDYPVNQVLFFYNLTPCAINEKGNMQQRDNCRVVFTFNTKQSTSLSDRELTKSDFAMVETNFKQIRTYGVYLSNTADKSKFKLYQKKIIALLTDSYKIKSYIDGCIKFFSYMEKYKNLPGESPTSGLFPSKK